MLYPDHAATRDPRGILGRALGDEREGVFLFRSGWQGRDDVLVSIAGDFRTAPGGWDAAEAFRLSILGAGTLFAGTPPSESAHRALSASRLFAELERGEARYDEAQLASTLLVDGREFVSRGGVGAPGGFRPGAGGGVVTIEGGSKYRALGVRATRFALVDFDVAGGPAVISTVDRVRARQPREVTYQLVPGNPGEAGPVELSVDREGGLPGFTMRGRDGASLRGLVVTPPDARVTVDGRVRVSARGDDVVLWVVLLVGRGAPPAVLVEGQGPAAVIRLRDGALRWDGGRERLLVEPASFAARR